MIVPRWTPATCYRLLKFSQLWASGTVLFLARAKHVVVMISAAVLFPRNNTRNRLWKLPQRCFCPRWKCWVHIHAWTAKRAQSRRLIWITRQGKIREIIIILRGELHTSNNMERKLRILALEKALIHCFKCEKKAEISHNWLVRRNQMNSKVLTLSNWLQWLIRNLKWHLWKTIFNQKFSLRIPKTLVFLWISKIQGK